LLTVSRSFMNFANSVLWRMTIILKANKVNLFSSSVLFVFRYHSPNVLDTPRIPPLYVSTLLCHPQWAHTGPAQRQHQHIDCMYGHHTGLHKSCNNKIILPILL
jgi:hypothetical protein